MTDIKVVKKDLAGLDRVVRYNKEIMKKKEIICLIN